MPIEVMTASAEEAAAGVAELWLDGRLFASSRMEEDRRIVLEIREGPWVVDLGELHRALERMEELIGWERPGAWRGTQAR